MLDLIIYLLLFSTVVVRFFIETVPVLPEAVGFADVGLLGVLAVVWFLRFLMGRPSNRIVAGDLTAPTALFVSVAAISAVLNAVLWGNSLLPLVTFLLFFLEPIMIAFALANLGWSGKQTRILTRALVFLALMQVLAGVWQIPVALRTGNPDVVSGTFGRNGSQMDSFLAVAGAYMLGRYLIGRKVRWLIALPAMTAVYYANAFKAMWIALPATMCFVVLFFSRIRTWRKVALVLVLFTVAASAVVFLARKTTQSTMFYFGTILNSRILQIGKLQAAANIGRLYSDVPYAALVGVGPGSYSSRSFQYFSNLSAEQEGTTPFSDLGGLLPHVKRSRWANRYVIPILLKGGEAQLGSWTMDGPYSSYFALLGEVGILGLAAYAWLYARVFKIIAGSLKEAWRTRDERKVGITIAGLVGLLFLAQMACFDNWIEVGRVTVPIWLLVVPVLSKRRRLDAFRANPVPRRQDAPPPPVPAALVDEYA